MLSLSQFANSHFLFPLQLTDSFWKPALTTETEGEAKTTKDKGEASAAAEVIDDDESSEESSKEVTAAGDENEDDESSPEAPDRKSVV